MVAQTDTQGVGEVMKVVDILFHLVYHIHYYVNMLSVYLGNLSSDVENKLLCVLEFLVAQLVL